MSIENNGYNGWPNYATWRVNLEMFDGASAGDIMGIDPDGVDRDDDAYKLQAALKEHAEYLLCEMAPEGLARDYALAFLSDVDWHVIAYHMVDAWAEDHYGAYTDDAE
jgi:hypothetical protein